MGGTLKKSFLMKNIHIKCVLFVGFNNIAHWSI